MQTPHENLAPASELAVLKSRAQRHIDCEQWQPAVTLLEMIEIIEPTRSQPGLMVLDILLELGLSDAATQKLQELELRFADDPELWLARARVQAQQGHLKEALDALRDVFALRLPETHTTHMRAMAVVGMLRRQGAGS